MLLMDMMIVINMIMMITMIIMIAMMIRMMMITMIIMITINRIVPQRPRSQQFPSCASEEPPITKFLSK